MNYFKQKKEEYITNQIVEHICIALTPVTTIHGMKEPERTQALRKKAWLIQLRKRLVQKIETVIASGTLSHQHTQALSDMLSQTKTVFSFVDLFRRNNEFEAEYEKPTLTDSFIESEMVRSIMLSTKPNEECTQEELLEKERAVTRRNLIVQKVTSRGIKNYLLAPLMLLSMI